MSTATTVPRAGRGPAGSRTGPAEEAGAPGAGAWTATTGDVVAGQVVAVLRPLRIPPALRPLAAAVALLALIGLQSPRSLWLAEALAVRTANRPVGAFDAALRADDLATAVSQLLTRPIARYTTVPELLRAPGYVCGFLTVLLLASTARRLGSLVVGDWRSPSLARPASMAAAAALLAACNGFIGATAAEVGPYAVTLLAVAAAVDLVVRVAVGGRVATVLGAGLVGGVAAATHLGAALTVAAALAALALLPDRRLRRRILAALVALTAAVAVPLVALTVRTPTGRDQWLGTPGEGGSVSGALGLLAGGVSPGAGPGQPGRALSRLATLALVLLTALALLHLARMLRVTGRSTATFVLALPLALLLVPVVGAAVERLAGVSDAAGRNLVVAVPGVVLLAAVELFRSGGPASAWLGFAEWRNGYSAAAVAATGALLGSLLVGVGALGTLPCVGGRCAREQWSVAVGRIEALRAPGDAVIVYAPVAVLPYDLAATRVDDRLRAAGERPLPRTAWPATLAAGLAARDATDARARQLQVSGAVRSVRTASRVWVVLSHATGARATAAEEIDRALTRQFKVRTVLSGVHGSTRTVLHRYVWNERGVTVQLFTHSDLPPQPLAD